MASSSVIVSQEQTHPFVLRSVILRLGIHKPQFSFISWTRVRLCQRSALEGDCQGGGRWEVLLPVPSLFLLPYCSRQHQARSGLSPQRQQQVVLAAPAASGLCFFSTHRTGSVPPPRDPITPHSRLLPRGLGLTPQSCLHAPEAKPSSDPSQRSELQL